MLSPVQLFQHLCDACRVSCASAHHAAEIQDNPKCSSTSLHTPLVMQRYDGVESTQTITVFAGVRLQNGTYAVLPKDGEGHVVLQCSQRTAPFEIDISGSVFYYTVGHADTESLTFPY